MAAFNRKEHWEHIYQTKGDKEVSWFQNKPEASLRLFRKYAVSKESKIIDVGGGNSRMVEYLLQDGYENVTVLDISATALEKNKRKLGPLSEKVQWTVADITTFQPHEKYDVWHDRAVFHFLTTTKEIGDYITLAGQSIVSGGLFILAAFSDTGPDTCSGLTVSRYSAHALAEMFSSHFYKEECCNVNHQTPFGTIQNFTYCCLRRK